ncbi:Transcription factor [Paramyrothecium foliicola]|nr:Transcription factor [Paramyrothecium foliicola]
MAPPDLAQPAGSPAGYGKSCMNCSRAKCKCILRPEGSGCERCHRLGKECQPMTTARKRTTKKSTSSRTAQLEEKLEDLVSILRATQQQPNQQVVRPEAVDSLANVYTSRLDSLATAATVSSHQPQRDAFRDETRVPPYTPSPASGLYEPSPKEAERRLGTFRAWLKNLPFMHLPDDMTAASLRQERPFLWMCINNITSMTVREQQILKDKVRSEVAQRVIVDFERSMDILLGLLTCLGWITMHIGTHNKPFMATYAQLALAVVSDLGLVRTTGEENYISKHFKAWAGRLPSSKPRTIEERRAIIGYWFIASTYSCVTGRTEVAHWTSHMRENLEFLEQHRPTPLDEVLTTLVRTQLIADETVRLLVSEVAGNNNRTPTHLFRKSLLQQLEVIRENSRARLGSHYGVHSHMLSTELFIHSLGSSRDINPDLSRIEGMYSCLQTIKAWYDIFFAIPLIETAGLPFFYLAQQGQVLSALYRLATSDDPDWDKRIVFKTADLLVLLEQTIQRLMQISSVYPVEPDGEDVTYYEKVAKILRGVKSSWEPSLNQQMGELLTPNSQAVACAPGGTNPVDGVPLMPDPYAMDFNEMAWMSDVFGPWEM